MPTKKLLAIDLFSGCGGLTQGLKQARYRVLAAVEIDTLAAKIYSKNHRSTKIFNQDISKLSPNTLMGSIGLKAGDLDLLAGCPPCQGFSSLRTRNGSRKNRDVRNALVNQIVRFARVLRPKAVMLENVPRLAKHSSFKKVLLDLQSIGYIVSFRVDNAADFGVPQRRKRLIMLAMKRHAPKFANVQPKRLTVRQAIGEMPPVNTTSDRLHVCDMSRRSEKVIQIIAHIPKDGGSRKSLPLQLELECHKGRQGFNDVYGRMRWDDVAPTITGGCYNPSKGRFLHPELNRPITLREAALLQGFPLNYQFDHKMSQQAIALMIGNALPPPFVAEHAKAVAKLLRSI